MCIESGGSGDQGLDSLRIWMMVTGKGGPCLVRPEWEGLGCWQVQWRCGYKKRVCTVTMLGKIYRCFLVYFFEAMYCACVCVLSGVKSL